MNFTSDEAINYDGISTPTLPPGKYSGELINVKLERPTNDAGEALKRRIIFSFKTDEGENHTHIEYDIDPEDAKAESKATNLVKRVGHMMSKFVSKEALVQNNTSFSDYGKWVLSTLEGKYTGVKVDFIVVGNVWDGKASSGFPGYPPFIANAGNPLGFDTNHNRSNKQYEAFMSATNEAPKTDEPASAIVTEGDAAVKTGEPDF